MFSRATILVFSSVFSLPVKEPSGFADRPLGIQERRDLQRHKRLCLDNNELFS
jgi:hypothetical protein